MYNQIVTSRKVEIIQINKLKAYFRQTLTKQTILFVALNSISI